MGELLRVIEERDALKAELSRERASLAAACEASDRRAADLNREVIANNERLKAELDACWLRQQYDAIATERDALRVVSKACRERNEVLCAERDALKAEHGDLLLANEDSGNQIAELRAEVERLQRAAVPGNGPEMLRMQRESGRLRAEVETNKVLWSEWAKDKAERDALRAELAALDACNTRDINALASVQAENERLKAELAEAKRATLNEQDAAHGALASLRELREKYREPPTGMKVRAAARARYALDGPDAQALEGALQQVERELRELSKAAREVAEHNWSTGPGFSLPSDVRAVELQAIVRVRAVLAKGRNDIQP